MTEDDWQKLFDKLPWSVIDLSAYADWCIDQGLYVKSQAICWLRDYRFRPHHGCDMPDLSMLYCWTNPEGHGHTFCSNIYLAALPREIFSCLSKQLIGTHLGRIDLDMCAAKYYNSSLDAMNDLLTVLEERENL